MNHKEFNDVVTKELDYVRELLCSKSKEYDFGEDRFHSFKVGGQLQGISQEKCLLGYLTKHIISIYDMCGKVEEFSFKKLKFLCSISVKSHRKCYKKQILILI